jgi:hypothetical protein
MVNEVKRSAEPAESPEDALRPQVRVLAAGAVAGVVLFGAALVVDLAGLNDPATPQVPQLPAPGSTSVPRLPGMPSVPPLPSGLPSNFPTTLPSFPTNLPGLPTVPGGAP